MYRPNTTEKWKKCFPNLTIFFTQRRLRQRWWKYFFEYLLEVKTEFENN